MTVKEAEKVLKDVGITLKLNVENEKEVDKKNTIVKDQTPKSGIITKKNGMVMCEI